MGYAIRRERRKNLRWQSLGIEEAGFHDKKIAEMYAKHMNGVNREKGIRYKVYKI